MLRSMWSMTFHMSNNPDNVILRFETTIQNYIVCIHSVIVILDILGNIAVLAAFVINKPFA